MTSVYNQSVLSVKFDDVQWRYCDDFGCEIMRELYDTFYSNSPINTVTLTITNDSSERSFVNVDGQSAWLHRGATGSWDFAVPAPGGTRSFHIWVGEEPQQAPEDPTVYIKRQRPPGKEED